MRTRRVESFVGTDKAWIAKITESRLRSPKAKVVVVAATTVGEDDAIRIDDATFV